MIETAAILLCVAFLAYVARIFLLLLRRAPDDLGDPALLRWHLLIPCLDEDGIIERSIARLRADHPDVHLWCIDDDSADGTGQILARLAHDDPFIHVVFRRPPQARQGKGAALNAGWQELSTWLDAQPERCETDRVIVGVLDADGRLARDAPNVLAGRDAFGNLRVGAVQIQVRMVNRGITGRADADDPHAPTALGRALVTLQDLEFRTVVAAMQNFRHGLGSAGMGGNGQFSRLSVLNAVASTAGTPWHGALLEDYELGLHVLLAGYETRYCDDTWVAQEGLPKLAALVRQRTRWAQGSMQCAGYLRSILSSSELSTPAALEICYFLMVPWTQLLGTVVYLLAAAVLVRYALADPAGVSDWLGRGGWALLPLGCMFGVAPIAAWGWLYRIRCEPGTTRRAALRLAIGYWLYSYLMLASVWRAFGRVLASRNGWVKTRRVNVGAPVLPTALSETPPHARTPLHTQ